MTTRSKLFPVPIAIVLLLAACTTPTPYQPVVEGFGYSEQRLEENRYRVVFAGNDVTPRETVQTYMLYRAAELTVANGFDYFTVVDRDVDQKTVYRGTGQSVFSGGTRYGSGVGIGIGTSSFTGNPIDSYTASADVVLFDGTKPADNVDAYDARDVLRSLDPEVIPAPGVMRVSPDTQQ